MSYHYREVDVLQNDDDEGWWIESAESVPRHRGLQLITMGRNQAVLEAAGNHGSRGGN